VLSASGLRHIVLASGHDIPLQLLPAGHQPAGVTMYGSYDYAAGDLAELQVRLLMPLVMPGLGFHICCDPCCACEARWQ
jgi:hypothetical protein